MFITRNTPGMSNNQTNLVDAAIEKAKSGGELSATEVQELRTLAGSDGNVTGTEELFLQSLEDEVGRQVTSAEINGADFDPATYQFYTEGKVKVQSGTREIEMEFTDTPAEAKTIHGNRESAQRVMLNLIPADQRRAWASVDKHNVSAVRDFINGLNLNTPQKAEFLEAYMTAHYNHVGKNIEWNGASLQEGITAVPTDSQNRKYIDCEAYAEIARSILGDQGFTPLSVSTSGEGQQRDHQVSVYRSGDDAYVLSNNEVTRVPGGAGRDNQSLVHGVYPGFTDTVRDPNGAMLHDTSNYQVGNTLTGTTSDGDSLETTITQIDGPLEMRAEVKVAETGGHFHNHITINAETGDHASVIDPQVGDVFPMGSANGSFTVTGPNGAGIYRDDDGNQYHGRVVSTGNENNYRVEKTLQAGDVLKLNGGGTLTMDSATTGRISSGKSNYHTEVTLEADGDHFSTSPRLQAGDSFYLPAHAVTIQASSATQGTAVFDDGRPSRAVSMVRQADGSYTFN